MVGATRIKKVVDFLKTHSEQYYTADMLCTEAVPDEQVTPDAMRMYVRTRIMPRYPEIRSARGFGYKWVPQETPASEPKKAPAEEPKKTATETPYRNSEGYSDPTAGKALASLESSYKPGQIWHAEARNGDTEWLLVVKGYKARVHVLMLYPEKKREWDHPLRVHYKGDVLWTDPTELTWRSAKQFTKFLCDAEKDEYVFAKNALGKFFGIIFVTEVTKEVPKIRYIEVPKLRTDPELVKRAEAAEKEAAELRQKLESMPTTEEPTEEVLVLKTQLATYREIFTMIFPERRTDED